MAQGMGTDQSCALTANVEGFCQFQELDTLVISPSNKEGNLNPNTRRLATLRMMAIEIHYLAPRHENSLRRKRNPSFSTGLQSNLGARLGLILAI